MRARGRIAPVIAASVLALAACAGNDASATPSASASASSSAATSASPSPAAQFIPGDMARVLAEVALHDEAFDSSKVWTTLTPGDLVLVFSGPIVHDGHDWYEVGHHGYGGWLPAADDERQYLALDVPDPNAETWDMVLFGDSSSVSPDMWAERIEERLGVEVRIHSFWGAGVGGAAPNVLEAIKTDGKIREAIAGAEVVSLEMNPGMTVTGDAVGKACVGDISTPVDPPAVYTIEDYAEYADLWRQVYDEIFALRDGQPTVVRVMDIYVPVLDAWTAAGIEAACTANWEAMSATVRMVADEYGVLMASAYDAFNGTNHDEDPVDKGYIDEDDVHPNEEGRALQVEILDALGYDPIVR